MDKLKTFFKEYYGYLVALLVVILIKTFVVAPIKVNGQSMMNTLKDKDIMILDKISYKFNNIKRFDIVVVKYNDEYLIKRVIALPRENVYYKGNKLYINGKKIDENFKHKKTDDFSLDELESTKVPDNMYFVLGDNRSNSMDSRIIGFIPKDKIIGKTSLTIFPFNRMGTKK